MLFMTFTQNNQNKWLVEFQTERFADGSLMGYTIFITDLTTNKIVHQAGLYTTLDFAKDAAIRKIEELENQHDRQTKISTQTN